MRSAPKINVLQLFIMLLLSRISTVFTINSQALGEGNFLDHILSSLLAGLTLFLLILPLYKINKDAPEESVLSLSCKVSGLFGKAVSALYIVYFILLNTVSLSVFLTLVINTMSPSASAWSIAAVLLAISVFGASKGVEAISRASICIFLLLVIGLAAVFIALIPRIEPRYLEPLLYDGIHRTLRGYFFFLSGCTSLAEIAVMMSYVRGRKVIGFTVWNSCTVLFTGILFFFVVSCLGEYAYLQIFPVYTLSTLAEIAGIQRLDALMIGLSMMTLVIRVACGLFIIGEGAVFFSKKPKIRTSAIFAASALIAAASLWITQNAERTGLIFRTEYLLPLTGIVSFIVPMGTLLAIHLKKRRRLRR